MDILNEVVKGRTHQTRHLKSHHLQGGEEKSDLLNNLIANEASATTDVGQQGCQRTMFERPKQCTSISRRGF